MNVLRQQFVVSLAIWLSSIMLVQAQTDSHDRQSSGATIVADARIEGMSVDAPLARAKKILAHGTHTEPNITASRNAPPYAAEITPSRVGQLSVDWVAPKSILLNQEVDFELVVRNRGPVAAQEIQVKPMLPAGSQLVKSDPPTQFSAQQPTWRIASLDPQEEFRITLSLILDTVGLAQADAQITYSTSTSTAFNVVQPKLKVTTEGPESIIVGNQLFFQVKVTNPGTGPTENTTLKVLFPEGIERVANSADYDIGILNPGESRAIRVPGIMSQLGQHSCSFVVTSDYGLRDEVSENVIGLGADIACSIDGPSLRYINRAANYTLRIANNGTAPASNVNVRCAVPQPFAFLQADLDGTFDSVNKEINWFFDHLDPSQEIVVNFRLQATIPGVVPIFAEVAADRGLRVDTNHVTAVEGIAAILLEVVDVDDPIEVGADTFYEILVTNQGTAFAKNVVVTAEVPEEMAITGSQGPTHGIVQGQTIRFAKIPKLAPRADAIYRINVRGLQAKDVRIRVLVDAETLDEPVLELESTKVYED